LIYWDCKPGLGFIIPNNAVNATFVNSWILCSLQDTFLRYPITWLVRSGDLLPAQLRPSCGGVLSTLLSLLTLPPAI
jgi:hypothetical protein